ncbi:hypothetical protein PROFUN_06077 [Planoprotostelium fungivorum]|uniref:Uncharacterized protein n=1 Tax=Planoprotostelium fungivorum TaxID=1890364 RepID=A0A2P6NPS4_9EUKA|nr:hypothetical protein PROFUN_06077 [Planoprotostelium fungivorum]
MAGFGECIGDPEHVTIDIILFNELYVDRIELVMLPLSENLKKGSEERNSQTIVALQFVSLELTAHPADSN